LSSRGTKRSRLSCAGKQKRRDCFSGSHFYVIASAAWRSRLSCAGKQKRRDCFAGSHFFVIASLYLVFARNVAISVVIDGQGVKIEIASQARNDSNIVSSRAYILSSRAQRGDLGCEALTKKKREIASQARNDKQGCHRERSVAISPVVCWQTEKTRLFLRLTFLCLREERGDLGCYRRARSENRDCFAGSQ
jgi:hypothetical protein